MNVACRLVLAAGALLLSTATTLAAWPERPVTIIVPSGAGGGTDATGRLLAFELEKRFGQPFNVVNQGQGGGVIGITSIVTAVPDGYTLGVLYNFAHYKPLGQGDFDADQLTAIAQFNFDPAGFQVPANSEWSTLREALDAIKANPGGYDISCGGACGGSWPMAVATLMNEWDIDLKQVRMIPGQNSAAALQEMVAGGLDVVPCSLPEAKSLIDAGLVKSLGVFGAERISAVPDVPTVQEELGLNVELGAWRGVVGPTGLPADIAAALTQAIEEIYNDPAFQQAMTDRGFGLRWRNAEDFAAYMAEQEVSVRQMIADLGL